MVWKRYKCYVCERKYPPEELGRVRLPFTNRAGQEVWLRVVCYTCYTAISEYWSMEETVSPILFHGF